MSSRALLYDGQSADRHKVVVVLENGQLLLSGETIPRERIDIGQLERASADTFDDHCRLRHMERDGWTLMIPLPLPEALEAALPKAGRYGGIVDRVGVAWATGAFLVVTLAFLAVGYGAPQWLAPYVPASWERNVGSALVGDFGDLRCRSPEADQVLMTMVERLDEGQSDKGLPIRVSIINLGEFNAAALPGGNIVIFRGALGKDMDGDLLAGVVAHEIAHVRERHVAESLIREFGIGALIRLFAGDIGARAQDLVGLSYTRDNEHEADKGAIAMLDRANITPDPIGDWFDKWADGGEIAGGFLDSHPANAERAQLYHDAEVEGRNYKPAFSAADLAILRRACAPKDKE